MDVAKKLEEFKTKLEELKKAPAEDGNTKQLQKRVTQKQDLAKKIANLEAYLSFSVGQQVTNGFMIGVIVEKTISPGGMPEIWVSWNNKSPSPEEPMRLKLEPILPASLNVGDLIVIKDKHPALGGQTFEISKFIGDGQITTTTNEVFHLSELANPEIEQLPLMPSEPKLQQATETSVSDNGSNIIIDPELKALIPPLSAAEKAQLEKNCIASGIRDPLVIWKHQSILLDGHNRLEIARNNNLPFTTVSIELEDRDAARLWLIDNQLGRRNLLPEQASYLRGQKYNLEKTAGHGAKQKSASASNSSFNTAEPSDTEIVEDYSGDQNDPQLVEDHSGDQNDPQLKTAQRLANAYKVGSGTIKRDGQFATQVDLIRDRLGNEYKNDILTRVIRLSKKAVAEIAEIAATNPEKAKQILTSCRKDYKPQVAKHLMLTPGCLVVAKTPDKPHLNERTVRVAQVSASRIQVWHRNMETLRMSKHTLKLEEVEFVPLSDKPHVQALCDRLSRLRKFNLDPIEQDLLELFDRCVALTPAEEKYLSLIEDNFF